MPFLTPRARIATAAAGVLLAVGVPTAYATLADEAPAGSPSAAARGKAYIETRLFFGTERPDGGPGVTDKQFMGFIDREVTRSFPSGLTIQEGRGQYRDANGVIQRERSYELILLYPTSEAKRRDPQIERIRTAYERAFGQESVARLEDRASVDF